MLKTFTYNEYPNFNFNFVVKTGLGGKTAVEHFNAPWTPPASEVWIDGPFTISAEGYVILQGITSPDDWTACQFTGPAPYPPYYEVLPVLESCNF